MAHPLKANTKLIEIESGKEWRMERRTRGQDVAGPDSAVPKQTWVIILANAMGHKQFIPEERIWTLFKPWTPVQNGSAQEAAAE